MKYRDDFGNLATIDEVFVLPYERAKERERAYRLKLISEYDDDFATLCQCTTVKKRQ